MRTEDTATKLGYKLGDQFEVLEHDGWFSAGDTVELARDDGSMNPWFKGLNGCKDGYGIIGWMKKINTNGEESNTMTPCEKQVTLREGDYIATDGLSEDDYHNVARAFMAAGCDDHEYDENDWPTDCWVFFGWEEDQGLAHWDSANSFEGSQRQLTLSQVLSATNAGGVEPESTTENTTEEQPMPQQHLADQLEAALIALDNAQSEVDRLQSEYRAAYPKIHDEVAIKNHVPLEKWVAGDIVVSAISDYGFTAGKSYRLHKDEYGDLGVTDDVGDKQYGLESYANIDLFWHSRP